MTYWTHWGKQATDGSMGNQRLRAQKRLEVLKYAETNGNVRQVCKRFGISPMTFYSWRGRYEREGLPGLENKSSAPKKHYRKVTKEVEKRIVARAKEGFLTLAQLCAELRIEEEIGICPTTLSRYLKRNNLDINALEKGMRNSEWFRRLRKGERMHLPNY